MFGRANPFLCAHTHFFTAFENEVHTKEKVNYLVIFSVVLFGLEDGLLDGLQKSN